MDPPQCRPATRRSRLPWLLLSVSLGAAPAQAAPSSGQDLLTLGRMTIDVLRTHQFVLGAQMERDEVANVYEGIAKLTPATFQLGDGTTTSGALERVSGGLWVGDGHPRSDWAWFAGFLFDVINMNGSFGELEPRLGNGLLFLGGATHGFQADVALRVAFSDGFTPHGHLALYTPPPSMPDLGPEDATDSFGVSGVVISLQHAFGIELGLAIDQVFNQTDDGSFSPRRSVAGVRAQFRPVPLLRSLGVAEYLLAGVGLERFAEEIDYYGDRGTQLRQAYLSGDKLRFEPLYQIPFELDDILGLGLHAKAVVQVAPTALFRLVEAGVQGRAAGDLLGYGGRLIAFRRGEAYVPAADVYLTLGGEFWRVGLSYSYNSLDASSGFPIADAHVFGVQVAFGALAMARPIVPIAPLSAKAPASSP